jgi:3-methyladenine DNA glycosylase AlkD
MRNNTGAAMTLGAANLEELVRMKGDPERATFVARYFKTGPGEYGEGDIFVGLAVPQVRQLATEHRLLPLSEIALLLQSSIHEARLLALFIMVKAWTKASAALRHQFYETYLSHTNFINNWDLVDMSAPQIIGAYLVDKERAPLWKLAASPLIWDRRISIMATFTFIKNREFDDALAIARILLQDRQDLIQKAVGWMLREVGKRDQTAEEAFLKNYYRTMPRTMLRYAIEKFPEDRRMQYLRGLVTT